MPKIENELGLLYHSCRSYCYALKVYKNLRKQDFPNVTFTKVDDIWEIRYKWNEDKEQEPEPQRVYSYQLYDYSEYRINRDTAIRHEEQYHNPFTNNNTIHNKFYRYGDYGTWS